MSRIFRAFVLKVKSNRVISLLKTYSVFRGYHTFLQKAIITAPAYMLNCAFRYSVSEVIPEGYLLPLLPHFVHHCCLILTIAVLIYTFFPLYPIHCISTSIWSPFCSPLSLFNQRLMPEDSICMSFCCYGSSLHRQILWADNWASVCVLLPPGETTQSCLLTVLTHTDIFRDWSIFSSLPAIWGACTCMLDLLLFQERIPL